MDPEPLLVAAESIAREAGEILLGRVGLPLGIERKGEADLVTQADRASEALILSRLQTAFPDHAILSEEKGGVNPGGAGAPLWIVDPLDGTTNFAHGLPIWSVSIACAVEGRVLAGVVHDPSRGECFTAARGRGARLNGRLIRVANETRLGDALLVTGFPYDVRSDSADNLDHFTRFIKTSRGVRRLGSAAIDLAYVACGRFDGFWEMKLHAWDIAAGSLIVEEAGGTLCDFEGRAVDPFGVEIVAANESLAREMVEILRQGKRPSPVFGASP